MRFVAGDWHYWLEPDYAPEAVPRRLKDLGFDGLELAWEYEERLTPETLEAVDRGLADSGLALEIVSVFYPPNHWKGAAFTSADRRVRARAAEFFRRGVDWGAERGVRLFGLWLGADRAFGRRESYGRLWDMLAGELAPLAAYAAERGASVAIEYKPDEVLHNVDSTLRMIERVGSDALGVLLDTGHALMQREDLRRAVETAGDRLRYVHLDDNAGDWDRDLPPGTHHNFRPFFQALRGNGYRGALGLDLYYGIADGYYGADEALRTGLAYAREAGA